MVAGLVAQADERRGAARHRLTRNHRKDGDTIWCEWYHSALLDDDGRIVSILSFVQDVSLAHPGGRAAAVPRHARRAHRPAQPAAAARAPVAGDRAGQAQRPPRRRAVHRPRPLQERQRHARPPHRRRAAEARHARAVRSAARDRSARAPRRRRVHGDRRGLRRSRRARPHRAEAARRDRAAVRDRGARHLRDVVDRHRGVSRRFRRPGRAAEARRRRDVPLEGLGRNTFQFLDANLAEHRLRQHTLETALRGALTDDTLQLHYQPVVRITDRAIVGAEALLRWTDPEHGNVPPQRVHPARRGIGPHPRARRMGAAHRRARSASTWRKAGLPLTISVNLSAKQFYREDLSQRISDIVRSEGCEPSWIELEVTETSLRARPRRHPQGAAPAARRRLHGRHRRLRHRLLVADAPEALPDRHAEDRHLVHRRSRDRPAATPRSPRRSSASRAASASRWSPKAWARASSSSSSTCAAATASRGSG